MTSTVTSILRASAITIACMLSTNAVFAIDWRQAHVRSVGPRPDADSSIDLRCAPEHPGEDATKVLVVSNRVGKSHAWRAFNLSADDIYAVGDEVIIDIANCHVARMPSDEGPAAPAP